MDDADFAGEEIERGLAQAIRRASTAPPEVGVGSGYCLFCFEDLKWAIRWCDADCRNGWERERKARAHPRNIKLPPPLEDERT